MRIALTGGIACGKSTLAKFLRELGIRLLDADDVVHGLEAPGGEAVPAIAARFGAGVLAADGSVDRPKLADVVFADPAARRDLEAILFPLVRARLQSFTSPAARRGRRALPGSAFSDDPMDGAARRGRRALPMVECSDVMVGADVLGRPPPLRPLPAPPALCPPPPVLCPPPPVLCPPPIHLPPIAVIPLLFESHWEGDYDTILAITSPLECQVDRMMRTRGYSRVQAEARLAAQMPVAEKAARADFVVVNDSTHEHLKDEARRLVAWLKERAKNEH